MSQTLSAASFLYFSMLAESRAGIVIEAHKEYLVESRLTPLAREHGYPSLDEMARVLSTSRVGDVHQAVVEALTTNETSFFRDGHPFELLRTRVLPEVISRRRAQRCLNIWCAAASTGQEPFSVAMLIREHFPELSSWDIRFVATDLNAAVLAKARTGVYSQLEVSRGLPAPMLVKYFQRVGASWQVREDIHRMIEFRTLNLLEPWPNLGVVDVVLMRNVLIYFDVRTKREIIQRVRQLMHPKGFLLLGSAETTLMIDDALRRVPGERGVAYQVASAVEKNGGSYAA
jgi:chemotaxis protein methyltransferase CheR